MTVRDRVLTDDYGIASETNKGDEICCYWEEGEMLKDCSGQTVCRALE